MQASEWKENRERISKRWKQKEEITKSKLDTIYWLLALHLSVYTFYFSSPQLRMETLIHPTLSQLPT